MPKFETNMQEWDGAYAPPRTVKSTEEGGWGELANKLAPALIEAAGKGYARAKGSNIQGLATTAQEAQTAVEDFEKEVPFTDDPSNTPDQRAMIQDMRDAALKKFGTNDKKIQALVSSGKISSLEANARRHQLLQDNLSNPVLAMFKEDFMEASKAFTGGGGKLAEQYFGAYMPTEEERAKVAAVDAIIEDRAKDEVEVQGLVRMGMSEQSAWETIKADRAEAAKVAAAEQRHKLRNYNSADAFMAGQDVVALFGSDVGGNIAKMVMSKATLTPQQIAQIPGELEMAKQEYMKKLDVYKDQLTPDDYKSLITQMNSMVDGYTKMLSEKDGMKFAKEAYEQFILHERYNDAKDNAFLRQQLGIIYPLSKFSPDLANTVVGAVSGNIADQYKASNNIVVQQMIGALGLPTSKQDTVNAADKIAKGDKKFSLSEAASFMTSLWSSGDKGVKAEMDLAKEKPEEHYAMLRETYSKTSVPLKNYRSGSWERAAQTPEGVKPIVNAIRAKMASLRGRQAMTGAIPDTKIVISPPEMIRDDQGQQVMGTPTYKINAKLDQDIKTDLFDIYFLAKENPLVLKELGAASAEELIADSFSEKALGK